MLSIIGSMEYELAGVRKALRLAGSAVDSGSSLYGGKPVQMLVTGVGRECTEASIGRLLDQETTAKGGQYQEQRKLLQLGFAGAVDPALHTGDLVLSSRYYPTESQEQIAAKPALPQAGGPQIVSEEYLTPDAEMWGQAVAAAEIMGQQVAYTDSLTVGRLVTTREMKREFLDKYPVGVVNMEDYWAGIAARTASVPYISVRVVLDTAYQALPEYLPSLAGSRVRATLVTAAKAWRIPTLVGLARQMRVAQGVLARFALNFLAQMDSGETDQQERGHKLSGRTSSAGSRVVA